jgi:ATP-dependent DNA ligase
MTTATATTLIAPAAMLASAMTTPVTGAAFDARYGGGDWRMDLKLDGHRCVVVKRGTDVVGWSRGGAHANAKNLPAHIINALRAMPDGIYDGELVTPGGHSWDVTATAKRGKLTLVLFDALEILGESLMNVAQSERRKLLALAVGHASGSAVVLVPEYAPSWATVEGLWKGGAEGVILKRSAGLYRPGYRSADWVKVKQLRSMVGTITGFEAGSFGPHAVTLLRLTNGTDTRVKTKDAATLRAIAKNPEGWIGKRLTIQFQQLTPSGSPRHGMWHEVEWDHVAGDAE